MSVFRQCRASKASVGRACLPLLLLPAESDCEKLKVAQCLAKLRERIQLRPLSEIAVNIFTNDATAHGKYVPVKFKIR